MCIPVYWHRIMLPTLELKTCESKNDMERIWNMQQNFSQIHSTYHLPCNEMKLTVTYDQQKQDNHWGPLLTDAGNPLSPKVDDVLSIESRYLDPNYQEIINERELGNESLWSTVRGFVGIFIGTSFRKYQTLLPRHGIGFGPGLNSLTKAFPI